MLIPVLAFVLVQHAAAAPTCTGTQAVLPPPLAGWTEKRALTAGAATAAAPAVPLGQAVRVALSSNNSLSYAVQPSRPAPQGSYGGLLSLRVSVTGRYRVALGSGAWVDLVASGKPLASREHAHGPACSGVHKTVDFDLRPGDYALQIVGNAAPTIDVMVVRVP